MVNYYEDKMLQDREARSIAVGIGLILTLPLFAIIGSFVIGVFVPSASVAAFFGTWAAVSILGILVIVQAIREKMDRRRHMNDSIRTNEV